MVVARAAPGGPVFHVRHSGGNGRIRVDRVEGRPSDLLPPARSYVNDLEPMSPHVTRHRSPRSQFGHHGLSGSAGGPSWCGLLTSSGVQAGRLPIPSQRLSAVLCASCGPPGARSRCCRVLSGFGRLYSAHCSWYPGPETDGDGQGLALSGRKRRCRFAPSLVFSLVRHGRPPSEATLTVPFWAFEVFGI